MPKRESRSSSVSTRPPSMDLTLFCKICKKPPICKATCDAQIFYVHGNDSMQQTCIHLGHHHRPFKTGDYGYTCKKILNALIEEYVEWTPQAQLRKIIMEASRNLLGEYLLHTEDDPLRLHSLEELEPIFDCCKELNSFNLGNKVTSFKYLQRFGVMDGITKLRGLSNWAFVQQNMFSGQGNDFDKVIIFKISQVGPSRGVDLVACMQPGANLEHAWLMSNHVNRVNSWTTMAYHVYDSIYQRVITIAYYHYKNMSVL